MGGACLRLMQMVVKDVDSDPLMTERAAPYNRKTNGKR